MEAVTMSGYVRRLAQAMVLTAAVCLGGNAALGQSQAQRALLDKAHSLEQSGHIDLAAQSWQQVLLSDPNNQEALAGLARWAKTTGNDAEAQQYLGRLRAVNPNSPEIPKIEALVSNKAENQMLQQAAALSRAGHNEEALKIFHQAFGTHPPDNWALAYYDTEAAIPALRGDAISGLRGLVEKYPGNPQYVIDLGRVLTYDAKTRAEGERILARYPQDAVAQAVLRQALVWDVQNPASAAEVRQYLKEHPDEELSKALAETEERQARETSGLAQTPGERAAFDALSANRLDAAQERFLALNAQQPDNPRVLAGLGFLRMKQSNFRDAVRYFEQAQHNGLHTTLIEQSLATSRFWDAMQQGTEALNADRFEDAEREYRVALAMRPDSADAMAGLAGLYMKMQQPEKAVPVYQQLVRKDPRSEASWKGLFSAQAQSGDGKGALATMRLFPVQVSSELQKDPEYLRALASAYSLTGQDAEAEKALLAALHAAPGASGAQMRSQTLLAYAALLSQNRKYAQAAAIYRDMITADPNDVNAWQGLVSMEHEAGRDADAITVAERMPPEAYDAALRDSGFLSMLAAIYQTQNHPDVAQELLERAVKLYADEGTALPIPLQLQVAALDLRRNHPDAAYRIYRDVLTQHPDRLDAWKGLLAALHQTDHDADALAQIQQIPPDVRSSLERDVEYQQTVAAVYAANGNPQGALALLAWIQSYYRTQRVTPPADVDIQLAWLLFNTGDDRDLYGQLMTLGGRTDMTDDQRRQVQTIWASWAQRRATQATAAGNTRRAVEILTAAAQAFPGNPDVSKALAAGYVQAGQAKNALAIYQSLDMTNASAADYQSMVGAALAAQNMKQAESWLRLGLEKFPNDAKVLAAAAQFEQARGDHVRAAEYWKASLNAMPPVPPATDLAHKLDQPEVAQQQRPKGPSDLVRLLNPEPEVAAQQGIPLPSYSNPTTLVASNQPYGPDPYYMGTAPVQLNSNRVALPPAASNNDLPLPPPVTGTAPVRLTQPDTTPQLVVPSTPTAPVLTSPDADTRPLPAPAKTKKTPRTNPSETTPVYRPPTASMELPPVRTAENDVPIAGEQNVEPAESLAGELSRETAAPSDSKEAAAAMPETPVLPPPAAVEPDTQPTGANVAERAPEQLVLDTLPARTPSPNPSEETLEQVGATLAAARQPADPSLTPMQYAAAQQEVAPNPEEQQPLYYERPPSTLNNTTPSPSQPTAAPGATDDELMRQNLPPLRGPYERPAVVRQRDLREQAQQQLANIQGGYSPWMGGTGFVNHRSGTAGYDALTALEAPFEASTMIGTVARLTVIARPTFLDSGAPTTAPILPGGVTEQLGTAPLNAVLNQQNAAGVGGEVQLATATFAASAGYSPYGFLVSNAIGRASWKPANGPFTFTFNRDSIKDSELSYAGLRDPGSAGPGYAGNVWGGVIATGGEVQFGRGDASSGYYVSGGGQYIDGVHVQTNDRIDADAGAYWRVKAIPDEGTLTVGANFFGMHYAHNLTYFTYGQGGYFSPQSYFLGNIPISWTGRYGMNLHYTITGGFGVQAFQEDSSPYFPLDSVLETANNNPSYPAQTIVGGNYDFRAQAAYHLTDHWYAGGFVTLNNTRDYNNQMVGFYVRYLFRQQIPSELGPTGLYPWDGLRPYLAP